LPVIIAVAPANQLKVSAPFFFGWKVSFYSIHNAASASARKNTMNTSSVSLVFVFMASPS
jgi:hypothetical protein